MTATKDTASSARDWLALDPDPETRAELEALLAADDEAELADRFDGRLQFGTAGLRGPLGAGPNRMNRVLVRAAAAGLASWLHDRHGVGVDSGVAVAFDARHKSRDFALDTAAVLAGAGIRVHLIDRPSPTPVLAFAVRHLGAVAGVMVTASHNPRGDNGYKVYDDSGMQVAPPAEDEISAAIDRLSLPSPVVLAEARDPAIESVGADLVDAYLGGVLALLPARPAAELSIVYSAMHGVGGAIVVELLERGGFGHPRLVAEQFEPDADFPSVAIPNPEEPGSLDLALAEARRGSTDLVLVNDPDADRLAVAVPERSVGPAPRGDWRVLSGDEIGVLLADALLAHPPVARPGDRRPPVLACSVVSSQMMGRMARSAGVDYVETLSGFKWIARAAGLQRRLLLGYEEALGYCVGDLVGDKDGISALLAIAQRAAELKAGGVTLAERLDQLHREHGLHLSGQQSLRMAGRGAPERLAAAMARLRSDPPEAFAGRPVRMVDDFTRPRPGLPVAELLSYRLDDARIVVRPSGTEPKLKCYCEVVRAVGSGPDGLARARADASAELAQLMAAIGERLL